MPKKSKVVQDEADEVSAAAAAAETPSKKKLKKIRKTNGEVLESNADTAPVEAETSAEMPVRKKRKKERQAVADEDLEAATEMEPPPVEEDRPKKKKKVKKAGAEAAEEAPEEPPEEADGKGLSKMVFLRGLPWSVDEDIIRRDFGECGEIMDLELTKDAKGRSKGVAFITYKDESGVKAALAYDGDDYGGRFLEVRRESAKGKGKGSKGGKGKGAASSELEVFVRGLSPKTKEHALGKEFSKCGEIERVKMDIDIGDGGRCKGYAWITFVDQAGMDKALERHGTEYLGHEMTVEKSGQHRTAGKAAGKGDASAGVEVFIRGLPRSTVEATVKRDFLECGEICKINMPMEGADTCKGYAWITYKTQEGADKACEFNGTDYGGSKLMAEIAGQHKGRDAKGKGGGKGKATLGPKPAGCTSVVVKKLSYQATEDDLTKVFGKCGGGPTNIKILTDWETGKSKGIAFVDFDSDRAVDEAIKLSGGVIKGHTFFMDYAKPREPLV